MRRKWQISRVMYDYHAPCTAVRGLHCPTKRQADLILAILVSTSISRSTLFPFVNFYSILYNMSGQQQLPPRTRTWEWIVFTCLTTLLPANSTILRPDPVVSAFQRTMLPLVLHVKTLLLPQLVLFEAVTHFGSARLIRDRVNEAARRCHYAYLATSGIQSTTVHSSKSSSTTTLTAVKDWIKRRWNLLCGNAVKILTFVWLVHETKGLRD